MVVHYPERVQNECDTTYPRWRDVPPLPSIALMATIGSPSIENFYVVGEAWGLVVSSLAVPQATILDIGCGCGRTARFLLHRRDIRYVGFDIFRPSVLWADKYLGPLSAGRFRFVHFDVRNEHYNHGGSLNPEQVRFPAEDAAIDLAFGASIFTHLLEPAARRYLAEAARCLKPGGLLLASIHDEPRPGERYSGNEDRVDIAAAYFEDMAREAGLAVKEPFGSLCGQPTLIFEKR
jgi:SAM-dependent methyltransferase